MSAGGRDGGGGNAVVSTWEKGMRVYGSKASTLQARPGWTEGTEARPGCTIGACVLIGVVFGRRAVGHR